MEKCPGGGPQLLFSNVVSLTDPKSGSVRANGEAAGCDKLFPTSFSLYLSSPLAISRSLLGEERS